MDMLVLAIAASVVVLLLGIFVPIVSNIKTPANLHDWYFGKQSVALWVGIGVCLIVIWSIYIATIYA